MKKTRLLAAGLTASLAVSMIGTASAANVEASVYAQKRSVEGYYALAVNEQNHLVPFLQYNGSTYIPIRTAGEWMGKNVS